jgi:hypothetical protein
VDLSSIYSEVKQLLSISDKNFDLEKNINHYYKSEPDENKLEIIGDILGFINRFSMFRDIKPFMKSLYNCINNTLEIKPDSISDFEELLTKNTIMHFVQEYINYSKLNHKDQVLKILVDSLEKLQIEPLIMNLGLLIKPIYQDEAYIKSLESMKEVEVDYNLDNGTGIDIKKEIDNWLKTQDISLDKQEELYTDLKQEFKNILAKHDLTLDSEKLNKLELEVSEMLTMKLTMLSLMEQIPDDSFEPIPIK